MTAKAAVQTDFSPVEIRPVGRKRKPDTKPIRAYKDVAELTELLAPAFGKDTSDLVDVLIRDPLEYLRGDAGEVVTGKREKIVGDHFNALLAKAFRYAAEQLTKRKHKPDA